MADTKDDVTQLELSSVPNKAGLTAAELELQQALNNYVPNTEAEKKLRRKIDLHLMPILWIIYILNYVDRTNIVSAFLLFSAPGTVNTISVAILYV